MGDGCVKDYGNNMEDGMILKVRRSSMTESGKDLGEDLALGSKGFE